MGLCQSFRDFEFLGDPNVYINREIQEVPVLARILASISYLKYHFGLIASLAFIWYMLA